MAKKDSATDHEELTGAEELDDFFSEIGDGTITIRVTRLDPPMGYCGEFYVTKSNPLTLKEIKRRFGGRVFQLNSRSSNGQIRKQKTISIDDVPRREGYEILPDGSTARPGDPEKEKKTEKKDHPLAILQGMGLPPHLMEQLAPWAFGYAVPPKKEETPTHDFEAMRQQSLLGMMSSQMQMQLDFQKQMMKLRNDMSASENPKNPLSDMETIFKMMREIKGFQSEIGGGEESLASSALQGTMDLVSNGLTEYLALKKLQAQSEIARGAAFSEQRPELQARQPAPAMLPRAVDPPATDPIGIARQMGEMFKNLDEETQQKALSAFFGEDEEDDNNLENIENVPFSDTMENEPDTIIDAEDQEILTGATVTDKIEAGDVSHSEHATPANDNDQIDRPGDTPGGRIPAN